MDLDEVLRSIASSLQSAGLDDEDAAAMMQSMLGPSAGSAHDRAAEERHFEAQDLAFEAMDAMNPAERLRLVKQALKIDPDCVDARLMRLELEARTGAERLAGLRQAVEAGERWLGAAFLEENAGHFWGLIETRPYMRALEMLASTLAEQGELSEAIAVYERMLVLNPNDNQGVRDSLLGRYLEADDTVGARRLFRQYKEDDSAAFAWSRVLERLLEDEPAAALKAFENAMEANRFVPALLAERRALPKHMPDMYSLGSREEALLYQQFLGPAWNAHPEAWRWLRDQCAERRLLPEPKGSAAKKRAVRSKE